MSVNNFVDKMNESLYFGYLFILREEDLNLDIFRILKLTTEIIRLD